MARAQAEDLRQSLGDNTKKKEEVKSLYKQYQLTKDDQRAIHDMITGKDLERSDIEKVIKQYKGIDCDK
ncbi:MAG TPA: hypothetical protein VGD65_03275 [Chryseosolibacter sp.]